MENLCVVRDSVHFSTIDFLSRAHRWRVYAVSARVLSVNRWNQGEITMDAIRICEWYKRKNGGNSHYYITSLNSVLFLCPHNLVPTQCLYSYTLCTICTLRIAIHSSAITKPVNFYSPLTDHRFHKWKSIIGSKLESIQQIVELTNRISIISRRTMEKRDAETSIMRISRHLKSNFLRNGSVLRAAIGSH